MPAGACGGETRIKDFNLEEESMYDIEFVGEELH